MMTKHEIPVPWLKAMIVRVTLTLELSEYTPSPWLCAIVELDDRPPLSRDVDTGSYTRGVVPDEIVVALRAVERHPSTRARGVPQIEFWVTPSVPVCRRSRRLPGRCCSKSR